MKMHKIRELDQGSIKEKLVTMRSDLAKEKALVASGTKSEKAGNVRNTKKSLARMLTVLRERELGLQRSSKKAPVKKPETTEKKTDKNEVTAAKKTEKKKPAKNKAEKKTTKKTGERKKK
jgi:large subunit ribosomal protein L29